jgi:hypothetical protein
MVVSYTHGTHALHAVKFVKIQEFVFQFQPQLMVFFDQDISANKPSPSASTN